MQKITAAILSENDYHHHHLLFLQAAKRPARVILPSAHINEDGFTKPIDSLMLRCFLGVTNYYRRYVPHVLDFQTPLTVVFKGCTSKKTKRVKADVTSVHCKQGIVTVTSTFLSSTQRITLRTNASSHCFDLTPPMS